MKARRSLVQRIRSTARQLQKISEKQKNAASAKRRRMLEKRLNSLLRASNPLRLTSISAALALIVGGTAPSTAQQTHQQATRLDVDNVQEYLNAQRSRVIRAEKERTTRPANTGVWNTQSHLSDKANRPARVGEQSANVLSATQIELPVQGLLPVTSASHAAFTDTLHVGPQGRIAIVELGDVDNDGDLDILGRILSTQYSNSRPYGDTQDNIILRNDGGGVFTQYTLDNLSSFSVPRLIDFDNDGDLDIIEVNQFGAWYAQRNTGWNFVHKDIGNSGASQVNDLQVRDADGDGDLDLTFSNALQDRIHTLTNNGSGVFSHSYEAISGIDKPVSFHADLDGDGDIDRVLGGADLDADAAITVELSDTIGSATTASFGGLFNATLLRTGDIDGDGDLDIVALGYDWWASTAGTFSSLRVFENDGSGDFSSSTGLRTGIFVGRIARRLILEDVDGDNDIDIAVNSVPEGYSGLRNNEVALMLNDGKGNFVEQTVPYRGEGAAGFAIGDIDGDGDLDIVEGAYNGRAMISYNDVADPILSHVSPLSVQDNVTTRIHIAGDYLQHREVRSKFFPSYEELSRSDVDASLISALLASPLVSEETDGKSAKSIEFDISPTSTGTIAVLVDNTHGQEVVLLNVGSGSMPAPDVSPAAYAQTVATNGTVQFDFGTAMALRGVEDSRIVAQSNFFGVLTTSQSLSVSGNTVSLALDREFRPNEKISITVTSANAENGSIQEDPLTFMFRTEPSGGTGFFEQRLFGGQSSRDIAGADFDGDGDIDLVCANYEGQPQTILWNDGDGYFTQESLHSASNDGVTVGDIDNDGDVDILFSPEYPGSGWSSVFVEPDDDKFQVLRNAGDGTFTVEYIGLPVDTDLRAPGVDLGDLDGDGDLDAVVARIAESFIMWNDGSGRFDAANQLDSLANRNTGDVKIADMNNDGAMDILFANVLENADTAKSEIWLNDGTGEFSKIVNNAPSASRIQVADFNNDGWLDVASVSYIGFGYVWLNNADETFSYHTVGGYGARGLGVGDFDGNGTQDIIQGLGNTNDQVLLNDGNANFAMHYTPYSTWSRDMEVADYNGDGKLDVAIPNSSSGAEAILINSTTRAHLVNVTPCEPTAVAQSTTLTVTFSDEMMSATLNGSNIDVWGTKSGWLRDDASLTVNPTTTAVVIALDEQPIPGEQLLIQGSSFQDADGTALPDVFSYSLQIQSATGNGEFASRNMLATSGVQQIESADMNGDGVADVVTYENGDSIKIYVYDTATGSVSTTAFAVSNVLTFVLVDKNNDGWMDIVVHRSGNGNDAIVYANNGDLSFSTTTFNSGFNKIAGAAVVDYNKDGEMDFLAQSWFSNVYLGQAGTGYSGSVGLISVFSNQEVEISLTSADHEKFVDLLYVGSTGLGVAHGTPTSLRSPAVYAYSSSVDGLLAAATGDASGDGIDEIIFSNKSDSLSIMWTTTGIPETQEFLFPYGYDDLALTDVNGDGLADIIALNSASLDVIVNADNMEFEDPVGMGEGGHSLTVCDIDGDGDLDVAYVDNDENLRFAFNNPMAPSITNLTPNATSASVDVATLAMQGHFNWDAEVAISTLDISGVTNGNSSPTFTQSTTNSLQVTTVPLNFATQGTLTVTVQDYVGSTSTSLIVSALLFGRQDYAIGTTSQTVDVLANDDGTSIRLLDAGNPEFGSVQIVNGEVVYTPDVEFYGLENLTYTFGFEGGVSSTGTLSVYTQAPSSGDKELEPLQWVRNGQGSITRLKRPRGAAVSRDGEHVYVSAYSSKAINHFTRAADGALTYVDNVSSSNQGVSYATQIALSPDGKHLYSLSKTEYAIGVFSVDVSTGSLTFVERVKRGVDGVDGLKYGEDIVVSPDGRNVYTVSSADRKLTVFRRDLNDGTLSYVERFKDGQDGVNRMNTPRAVSISPDGRSVYVAAYSDNAVTEFSRNEETGELAYLGEVRDNKSGVDGLYGASGVTVSPDGSQVFATGYRDNAVAVFDRSSTGTLTFVERFKRGVDGVDGIGGAYQVRASNSGQDVVVAGRATNSVALFSRVPSTGEIDFVEYEKRGLNGVSGLYRLYNVEIDPTSSTLYAMSNYDNSINVFEIEEDGDPKRGVEPQITDGHSGNIDAILYPQPAQEIATVAFAKTISTVKYEVVDMAGRVVATGNHHNVSQFEFPTGELASGMYYVVMRVVSEGGEVMVSAELVVQH